MKNICRKTSQGIVFNDLAEYRRHPHIIEHIERIGVRAETLADSHVLRFLDRVDDTTAPRFDPWKVANRGLRISQSSDFVPGHGVCIPIT